MGRRWVRMLSDLCIVCFEELKGSNFMFSVYKDNIKVLLNQKDIERNLCARIAKRNVYILCSLF